MFPPQVVEAEAAVLSLTRGRRTWSRRGQRGAEAAPSPRTRRRGRFLATDEEAKATSRHGRGGGEAEGRVLGWTGYGKTRRTGRSMRCGVCR